MPLKKVRWWQLLSTDFERERPEELGRNKAVRDQRSPECNTDQDIFL